MMGESFRTLFDYINKDFQAPPIDEDLLRPFKSRINDEEYFQLISVSNGGFFFNRALQVYSFATIYLFHDISYINKILNEEFKGISKGLIAFAQDIVGNQFCFNEQNSKIVFFNIESGQSEIMANSIQDWVQFLIEESDYFTGYKLLDEWTKLHDFSLDQRLCPKIPFVMGGGYTIDNLYATVFPTYIKSAANIARQVHNLPDGTKIKLRIDHQ